MSEQRGGETRVDVWGKRGSVGFLYMTVLAFELALLDREEAENGGENSRRLK